MSNQHHPQLLLRIQVALCMLGRIPQTVQKQLIETAFTQDLSAKIQMPMNKSQVKKPEKVHSYL